MILNLMIRILKLIWELAQTAKVQDVHLCIANGAEILKRVLEKDSALLTQHVEIENVIFLARLACHGGTGSWLAT